MKKIYHSLVMLLFLWLCVPWSAQAAVTFLEQNFDALTNNTLPEGWVDDGTPPANKKWTVYYSGRTGKSLRFDCYSNPTGNTGILKTAPIELAVGAKLTFWYTNASGSDLSVYVSTDDGATWTDNLLESKLTTASREWKQGLYSLEEFTGQTVRIVFVATSNNRYASMQIDDFIVDEAPTCKQPEKLYVDKVTQTSAVLNWSLGTIGADPGKYLLTVKDKDGNVVAGYDKKEVVTILFNAPISGLAANTTYKVTLTSDCSGEFKGSADAEEFEFTTMVDPMSIPFTENFEASSADMPLGWTMSAAGVTIYKYGQLTGSTYNIRLQANATQQAYIVTPPIARAANDMQVSFMLNATSKNTSYQVGVMSDPSDVATFKPVLTETVTVTNQWQEIRVITSSSEYGSEQGKFIAFYVPSGAPATFNIDNFTVAPIPPCPRAERLRVLDVDSTSCTIDWQDYTTASSYEVRYVRVGKNDTAYSPVTTRPAEVKGLVGSTEYELWVRPVCSEGEADWSLPVKLTTECQAEQTTEFVQNFDSNNMPECWSTRIADKDGTEAWYMRYYAGVNNTYAASYKPKYGSEGGSAWLISHPFHVSEIGKYDVNFWFKRVNVDVKDEGIRLWISNTPDTVGAQRCEFINNNYKQSPVEKAEGWHEYIYNIQKEGTVYLIFEAVSLNKGDIFLDDVSVSIAPSCRPVDDVEVEAPTTTTIGIKWLPGVDETQWTVKYDLTAEDGSVVSKEEPASTTSYTIENLLPATKYSLKGGVAAVCAVGDTSEYVPFELDFQTECVPVTEYPFIESFEGEEFPPRCWTTRQTIAGVGYNTNYGDKAWRRWNSMVNRGKWAAQLQSSKDDTHTILVLPQFDIPADGDYRFSFYLYRSTRNNNTIADRVKVFVNSTPDTINGTKLLEICPKADEEPVGVEGYNYYEAKLPESGLQYIIIEGINGKYFFIDDVAVEPVLPCERLQSFSVDSVYQSVARVQVTGDMTGSGWQVEYGEKGFALGTGKQLDQTTGNTIIISGLQPETEYDVYARRSCGENGFALWNLDYCSFKTHCSPAEITDDAQFSDDFEYSDASGTKLENCYLQQHVLGNSNFMLQQSISPNNGDMITPFDGTKMVTLKREYSSGNYSTWLYYPVQLKAGVNYEMSAYFNRGGNTLSKALVTYAAGAKPAAHEMQIFARDVAIANGWKQEKGYFNVLADGVYYLGLKVEVSEAADVVAVDNLLLRKVECIPPTESFIERVSAKEAVISWASLAGKWEVKVNSEPFDPSTSVNDMYNDVSTIKSVAVPNLRPNTEYYYAIRSICDDKPSDWTRLSSFRTSCTVQDLPVTEGFEDVELVDFLCWSTDGDGSYSRSAQIRKYGSGALNVNNITFVSPELNVTSLADLMMTGWVYSNSAESGIAVGVMTDPKDISTYEPVLELPIEQANKWIEFTAFFNEISAEAADARHIAVMATGEVDFYFDDLVIDEIPACPKPTDAVLYNVTPNSCDLLWTANAGEKQWKVTVTRGQTFMFDTVVTTNPATVKKLQPNTEYTIGISAMCSAADESRMTDCGTITTACAPFEVPYEHIIQRHVTQLPQCWQLGTSEGGDGDNYWKTSDEGFVYYLCPVAEATAVLQTAEFDLTGLTGALLDMRCVNYASDILEVLLSTDGGATYPHKVGEIGTASSDSYSNYRFDISEWCGNTVRIGLKAKSKGYTYMKVQVSELKVEPITSCVRPVSLSMRVGDKTETTITVQLNDTTDNIKWELVAGLPGFDPDNADPQEFTSKSNCIITGLQPNTDYEVYARSVCGEDHSYWRGPITVRTKCAEVVSLPYYESFEMARIGDGCFDILNVGTRIPNADVSTDSKYLAHGSQALQLTSSKAQPLFVVMPRFDENTDMLKISFNYCNKTAYSSNVNLELGVLPDVNDFSSFVLLETFEIMDVLQTVVFRFNELDPKYADARIAFRYGPKTDNYLLGLDNILVEIDESCPGVKLSVDNISQTDATFNAATNADKFQIAYGAAGLRPDDCTKQIPADDVFVIPALTKETNYVVYARGICGLDTGVWSKPMLFMTDCDVESTADGRVYSEPFDSYESLPLPYPPCYVVVREYVDQNVTYPILSALEPQSEPRALLLNGDNAVALPEFDVDANYLNLSFSVKGSGTLYVGVQDALDADAEFTSLDTIKAGVRFEKVECDLSLSGKTGKYIVLRSSTRSGIYIDDLEVKRVTDCFEPRNVRLVDLADSSAVITWTSALDATRFEYTLKLQNEEIVPATPTDKDTVTLFKLLPATDYTLLVKANCGDAATEVVEFAFRTKETLAVVPYEFGFEDDKENARWSILNYESTDKFIIGDAAAAINSGNRALYVSNNGTDYGYDIATVTEGIFACRTFTLAAGIHVISYDWKSQGNSSGDFGRVFIIPEAADMSDYRNVLYNRKTVADYIAFDGGKLCNNQEWKTNVVEFELDKPGRYNVVVAWRNNGDNRGGTPPLAVDNIVCQELNCRMLEDLKVAQLSHNAAQITYTNNNVSQEVEYRLCLEKSETSEAVQVDSVTALSFDLALTPNTPYYLYVRPVCGGGSVWQSVEFTTPCEPTKVMAGNPYVEDFETYAEGDAIESCWKGLNSVNDNWKISADNAHQGGKCVTIADYGNKYLLRDFYLEANTAYVISAWAKQLNKTANLTQVSVVNSRQTEPYATMSVGNEYVRVEHELYVATSGVYTLGFRAVLGSAAGAVFVDDIRVEQLPFGAPRGLKVEDIATDKASAVWIGDTERYQVVLSYAGGAVVSDNIVSEKTAKFTGLRPSTSYGVKVRSVSETDTSRWSSVTFATGCGTVVPNYMETFAVAEVGKTPYCWSVDGKASGWKANQDSDGNKYVSLACQNRPGLYGALRSLPVKLDDKSYNLTFRYINKSSIDTLKVSISTDLGNTFTEPILRTAETPEWTEFSYDLKAFAGETIVVEFKSTVSASFVSYAGIDDFRINCDEMADGIKTDTICQNSRYERFGFDISEKELAVSGMYNFVRYERAETADGCDRRFELNLFVPPVIEQAVYDTICQGDVYAKGEFANVENKPDKSGTYTLESETVFGCDSVVKLHLHVVDTDIHIADTICEGTAYPFGGKELTESGEYTETVTNSHGCEIVTTLDLVVVPKYYEFEKAVCYGKSFFWHDTTLTTTGRYTRRFTSTRRGCDSIEVMHFTVMPDTFAIEAEICQGKTYPFGSKTLSEPGVYVENYRFTSTALDCDSVVKLTLKVIAPDTTDFNDYICQDYPYTGYGHSDLTITKDTVILHTTKADGGCNIIERVFVDFIETVVVDTAVVTDKPYDFGGTTYTTSGKYTHKFFTDEYGCDSIVNLTLTITTGLDYNTALPLTIAPNPIGINDITYIDRTWTAEEQNGLTVEIVNSVGQIISTFRPEYYPIVIRSLNVSGVYLIRVTSGTGEVYMGRLIVR